MSWQSMQVWHPMSVDSCTKKRAAMLASPLRCGHPLVSGHSRALRPGAPPLCSNYSLVRRHGPLEAAEAIYDQEAPQLARITS